MTARATRPTGCSSRGQRRSEGAKFWFFPSSLQQQRVPRGRSRVRIPDRARRETAGPRPPAATHGRRLRAAFFALCPAGAPNRWKKVRRQSLRDSQALPVVLPCSSPCPRPSALLASVFRACCCSKTLFRSRPASAPPPDERRWEGGHPPTNSRQCRSAEWLPLSHADASRLRSSASGGVVVGRIRRKRGIAKRRAPGARPREEAENVLSRPPLSPPCFLRQISPAGAPRC